MASAEDLLNTTGLKNGLTSLLSGVTNLLKDVPSLSSVIRDFYSSLEEFEKKKLSPLICFSTPETTAIVLVDFQNDFVIGTLRTDQCPAKQNAVDIVTNVNGLLQLPFGNRYISYDWHPKNHISFFENKDQLKLSDKNQVERIKHIQPFDTVTIFDSRGLEREQKIWPAHCIAETEGSQIFAGIKLPESHIPIKKGTVNDVESYSVFGDPYGIEDTGLDSSLKQNNIRTVVFCGIAFDVCVAASALDALKRGYRVVVVEDACVGITTDGIQNKRAEMIQAGIHVTSCDKVAVLLSGEFAPLQHVIQTVKRTWNELTSQLV